MPHTKRTPDFRDDIARIVAVLRQCCPDSATDLFTAALYNAVDILEINTTDSPCIVKAADDEAIFVLRAQDDTADRYVNDWATHMLTIAANLTETAGELYDKIRKKAFDAIECAAEFRAYPNRKRPD